MRDSIIFYLSHYEVVKQMDNEQLGKLYRALFELALGNEPEIDENIKIPFGFIKNQMVLDIDKYNEKCLKNKENGKLGGRPKKNATEEKEKPKKANGFFENPNKNKNDNKNENDNKNDDDDLYNYFYISFGYLISSIQAQEIDEWRKVFTDDIIKYAIKRCCDNNVRTFSYLEGILTSWKSKGFKTLKDCQNESKKKSDVPDWFDKKIAKKTSEESQKEMEGLLKNFKEK